MSAKSSPIEQIKKLLSESEPPRYIAILATDRIRRERTLTKIAEGLKLQVDQKWQFDIKRIKLTQAKEQDLKSFIFESNVRSFFSKKQIFLIEELEKVTAKQTDLLVALIEQKDTYNFYFFLGTNLLSTSRLMKQFKAQQSIIQLLDFDLANFRNWVKQEFNSRSLNADPKVIEQLTQTCELSSESALAKIDMLELFADGQKMTLTMLEELFPSELSVYEYAWLEAISSGNKLQAQKLVSKALSEGKEALYLSALLQSNYLNYYLIASLRNQGYRQDQIQAALKMSSWIFNKQYSIASQKDLKGLIKDLKALVLADSKLKNKSLGGEVIFHDLINSLS